MHLRWAPLYMIQIPGPMVLLMVLLSHIQLRLREGLEAFRPFRLQNPNVNAQKGGQLEALLYREKRDIEGLQSLGPFLNFYV